MVKEHKWENKFYCVQLTLEEGSLGKVSMETGYAHVARTEAGNAALPTNGVGSYQI